MKNLRILIFIATTSLAQPSTIDQIKATIKEINKLLLSTPEIKIALDEQARLYKQKIALENKIGITAINKEYTHKAKEICIAKEKEIGALQKKLDSLNKQINTLLSDKTEEERLKIMFDPKNQNRYLFQEAVKLIEEIEPRSKPYAQKFQENIENWQNADRKIRESNPELNQELQKITSLYSQSKSQITQADTLFNKLNDLKLQLHDENPCGWKEIIERLEKDSILKSPELIIFE